MTELINNQEYRKKVLKELIMDLHRGRSVDEVKEQFAKLIEGVSAEEIAQMQQNLIMEGMPVSEVQRLCDVHAAVFKGAITDIHRPGKPEETPGHPVHTFKQENRALEKLIDEEIKPALKLLGGEAKEKSLEAFHRLADAVERLGEIDKHYSRKENLLFPYLEKYDITAPPKLLANPEPDPSAVWQNEKQSAGWAILYQVRHNSHTVDNFYIMPYYSTKNYMRMVYSYDTYS